MNNPADLMEVCETILKYQLNGDPAKDVIEQTPYSEEELIHELALFYVNHKHDFVDKARAWDTLTGDGLKLPPGGGPLITDPQ